MDGVLVDVSGSYRDTVRHTARRFLSGGVGFGGLPDPLFSLKDLAGVKQTGGLNNDWDLTAAVLHLLFTQVLCPPFDAGADPWHRHAETIGRCDLTALARYLTEAGGSLTALVERYGRERSDFVTGLYAGDVGTGNVVKQMFQEIYLGTDLFAATYGQPPRVSASAGLIDRESLLIDPRILESLARTHTLAVATGRPAAEADHALDRFGIRRYFSAVLTLDDCVSEEKRRLAGTGRRVSLSKPDPYMLDAVADLSGRRFARCFYIGDMPDDMVAAGQSRDGYAGIGVLVSAPDAGPLEAELLRAGAHRVIGDFGELPDIVG